MLTSALSRPLSGSQPSWLKKSCCASSASAKTGAAAPSTAAAPVSRSKGCAARVRRQECQPGSRRAAPAQRRRAPVRGWRGERCRGRRARCAWWQRNQPVPRVPGRPGSARYCSGSGRSSPKRARTDGHLLRPCAHARRRVRAGSDGTTRATKKVIVTTPAITINEVKSRRSRKSNRSMCVSFVTHLTCLRVRCVNEALGTSAYRRTSYQGIVNP